MAECEEGREKGEFGAKAGRRGERCVWGDYWEGIEWDEVGEMRVSTEAAERGGMGERDGWKESGPSLVMG